MSTCIAFKFVHSALDYESVAELNPSRANFLFSHPELRRMFQIECGHVEVLLSDGRAETSHYQW